MHNVFSSPDTKNDWTIHGIWPTKKHRIGPSYCNDDYEFDADQIKDLVPELEDRWTDIHDESDRYGFWKHEWEKHGTCAMQLPSMANEYLYFKKALELQVRFNATTLLTKAGIFPGRAYEPEFVIKSLTDVMGPSNYIHPAISCAYDRKYESRMFYELIVCLDKNFNLIGCEETAGGLTGSCRLRPMVYPDTINAPSYFNNRNLLSK